MLYLFKIIYQMDISTIIEKIEDVLCGNPKKCCVSESNDNAYKTIPPEFINNTPKIFTLYNKIKHIVVNTKNIYYGNAIYFEYKSMRYETYNESFKYKHKILGINIAEKEHDISSLCKYITDEYIYNININGHYLLGVVCNIDHIRIGESSYVLTRDESKKICSLLKQYKEYETMKLLNHIPNRYSFNNYIEENQNG
jgi:hypothetical protein